jgi:hemerythrin HHE cation binding domain-containing protein
MAQTQSETQQFAAGQTGKGATGREAAGVKSNPADPERGGATSPGTDPTEMLKSDHRHVEQLFSSFEKAAEAEQRSQLAAEICTELMVHTLIEEEIFYPACRGHMEQRLLDEAQVEHDGAKTLIAEIQAGTPDDQYFNAKVKVLSEEIKHHVHEEEKSDGVLAKAKEAGVATPDLAKRLSALKQKLMEQAKAGALGPPVTRTFRVRTTTGTNELSQEKRMARGSSATMERERDERGRFVSDDEDDRDYRRRSSSRSRYDDDDRRRSMPARDDEGRFTSSRSRYDDDDDDYRRGRRGHGGWFGDREGHSEASRRGWDNPDHGRSGWYGDPEGHSEASSRGWDEREGSRGRYRDDDRRRMPARDDEGRFMSSRSRYDDDDYRRGGRGHGGGWYGDPEGHSEAAQRGWDERGGSRSRYRDDDEDRRYARSRDDEGRFVSSRSRYDDDDDDDRRSGRGHGGWYGDPEGHSQAARRGRR